MCKIAHLVRDPFTRTRNSAISFGLLWWTLSNRFFSAFFRPCRLWIARPRPAGQRFASNGERLNECQIATPEISECLWVNREQAVSVCLYSPLTGGSLDQLYHQQRQQFDELLPALAELIHSLHRRGIYFRSLHQGNILQLPEGGFGLINFLDIRFKRDR